MPVLGDLLASIHIHNNIHIGLVFFQVLGDLVASIAAAIYLDSDLDAEISWKVRFDAIHFLLG